MDHGSTLILSLEQCSGSYSGVVRTACALNADAPDTGLPLCKAKLIVCNEFPHGFIDKKIWQHFDTEIPFSIEKLTPPPLSSRD